MVKNYTIIEHLEELRTRLIISIVTILISAAFCYLGAKKLLQALIRPPIDSLIFIGPHEAFFAHIKIAFFSGIFLALPVIIYQIWKFISVGLKTNEKKYIVLYGPVSFLLFILGALFAYFLVLPLGLKFLLGFGGESLQPMISVSKYVSFVGILLLTFGLIFMLPLIILFLTKIHLVTPQFLAEKRKHVVVLMFIIAAILTPPDCITQILMVVPLILLYELSIWLSRLAEKNDNKKLFKGIF